MDKYFDGNVVDVVDLTYNTLFLMTATPIVTTYYTCSFPHSMGTLNISFPQRVLRALPRNITNAKGAYYVNVYDACGKLAEPVDKYLVFIS
jgi:hypothetical protein